jgi:hypothetical protein
LRERLLNFLFGIVLDGHFDWARSHLLLLYRAIFLREGLAYVEDPDVGRQPTPRRVRLNRIT